MKATAQRLAPKNPNIRSILWLGAVFDEELVQNRRGLSPAANRWQDRMITALEACGVRVKMLSHIPEPGWPRGELLVRVPTPVSGGRHDLSLVPHLNIPGFRAYSICANYLVSLRKYLDKGPSPDLVVTYNTSAQAWRRGVLAKSLDIPWVAIIADVPSRFPYKQFHHFVAAAATGRVYLSWRESKLAIRGPSLHLDGGITKAPGASSHRGHKHPAILYCGALNRYGGALLLIQAFALVRDRNAELWICGKGESAELIAQAHGDKRIKFFGYVSDERLAELSEQCWLFVNPRPSAIPDNRSNFPSKILSYLSYAKPVISTWTDGLCPEYNDVLTVLEDETPACLARTIEGVLSWNEIKYSIKADEIKTFVNGRSWQRQAVRLLDWASRECLSSAIRVV